MKTTSYTIRYECGLARKFYDTEAELHYDERWMTCNWNNTWTKFESLDECVWVQCLYPPEVCKSRQQIIHICEKVFNFHMNPQSLIEVLEVHQA